MKKILLIAVLLFTLGLNAQNDGSSLSAPANLKATALSFSKIQLTWDAVVDGAQYIIYGDGEELGRTEQTSCNITDLEASTEYCFKVSTFYDEIESDLSEEACATTPEELICVIPENIDVNFVVNDPEFNKKYKITVSWDAVPEAELYAVYATSNNVPEPLWCGDAYGTSWVMGSDLGGELYFYVRTICDANNKIVSELSEGVYVLLSDDVETKIEAPKNLTATAKDNSSIELTWNAAPDAKSYFIYRDGEEIANIVDTTYLDENLNANTEYCYTVATMGVSEESDPSEEKCATTAGESLTELNSDFNIYPNPVENEIFITTEMNVEMISVYDIYGRIMSYKVVETQNSNVIDVADLKAGIYFVKIKTDNGELVKRFVKK